MAKKRGSIVKQLGSPLGSLVNLVLWVVGILVSLAVGFGMINGILTVLYIPDSVTVTAGWIVVILALAGALLKIIDKLRGY